MKSSDNDVSWFKYNNVYLLQSQANNEYFTIEDEVSGEFIKYINNNGMICSEQNSDNTLKAESLVHYTYANPSTKSCYSIYKVRV